MSDIIKDHQLKKCIKDFTELIHVYQDLKRTDKRHVVDYMQQVFQQSLICVYYLEALEVHVLNMIQYRPYSG